jgi:hypothetical protein
MHAHIASKQKSESAGWAHSTEALDGASAAVSDFFLFF